MNKSLVVFSFLWSKIFATGTIEFYAKGSGTIKIVTSNEVQGSFQGKNLFLNEEWTKYSHTFSIQNDSEKHKVKFWYLDLGEFIIDDIKVFKESF